MEYISKWRPNKETVPLFSLSAELRQALMQLTKTILACLPIITAGEVTIWWAGYNGDLLSHVKHTHTDRKGQLKTPPKISGIKRGHNRDAAFHGFSLYPKLTYLLTEAIYWGGKMGCFNPSSKSPPKSE